MWAVLCKNLGQCFQLGSPSTLWLSQMLPWPCQVRLENVWGKKLMGFFWAHICTFRMTLMYTHLRLGFAYAVSHPDFTRKHSLLPLPHLSNTCSLTSFTFQFRSYSSQLAHSRSFLLSLPTNFLPRCFSHQSLHMFPFRAWR